MTTVQYNEANQYVMGLLQTEFTGCEKEWITDRLVDTAHMNELIQFRIHLAIALGTMIDKTDFSNFSEEYSQEVVEQEYFGTIDTEVYPFPFRKGEISELVAFLFCKYLKENESPAKSLPEIPMIVAILSKFQKK